MFGMDKDGFLLDDRELDPYTTESDQGEAAEKQRDINKSNDK